MIPLISRVVKRARQASLLRPPQKMLEEVSSWVVARWATYMLEPLEETIKELQDSLVDESERPTPEIGKFMGKDSRKLVDLNLLYRELQKLSRLYPVTSSLQKSFEPNVLGWTALSKEEQTATQRFYTLPLLVTLSIDPSAQRTSGAYSDWKRRLKIKAPMLDFRYAARSLQLFVDDLLASTEHELVHYSQDLLLLIKDAKTGLPPKKLQQPGVRQPPTPSSEWSENEWEQYAQTDIEYHAQLNSIAKRSIPYFKTFPAKHWKQLFRAITAGAAVNIPYQGRTVPPGGIWDPFFESLYKKNRPKWRSAVKDLMLELGRLGYSLT